MSSLEKIFRLGKSYHTAAGHGSTPGSSAKANGGLVWEHAVRVWQLADRICAAHEIDTSKSQEVFAAAALFHDAGWMALVRRGDLQPAEVFSRPADASLRALSEEVLRMELGNVLPRQDLHQAGRCILELSVTRPPTAITQALADADNLEEMGLIGIFRHVRCAALNGKSPRHMLEVWRRQQEYHYWEARIKTGFNLDVSRQLARQRLEGMGRFFDTFERELQLEDLRDLVGERGGELISELVARDEN